VNNLSSHNLNSNYAKKIKVLQLGNAGDLYGAERWILALIKHLDPTKIESWVASVRDEPALKAPFCFEAEKFGIKSQIFDVYGKFNFAAITQLRKFILANDINIIHTHHYKTDIIGFFATKGTACKIVSTPHGWSKDMDFKLWCYEMLDRCVFLLLDAVAPLSEDIYRPLQNIPILKNKLYLIENGVDISEIDAVTANDLAIKQLKKKNTHLIGYIGQLISRKGLDVLLEAAAKITSLDWRIILIGDGEQKNELVQIAQRLNILDRVEFLGFRADRIAFLKGFDVFVLPSKLEGIPRCLMEALAAEVPVVASDIPGCRDLITTNETGLLFSQDSPDDLAQKIIKVGADKTMQMKFKQNGRQLIMEKFSAARMAEQYAHLYYNMVTNQSVG